MGMRSNWKKMAVGPLLALGAVAAVAAPGAALAATQGSLGATSTGVVTLVVGGVTLPSGRRAS